MRLEPDFTAHNIVYPDFRHDITNLLVNDFQQVVRQAVAGFQEEPATQAGAHAVWFMEQPTATRPLPHFETACFNLRASVSAQKSFNVSLMLSFWKSVNTLFDQHGSPMPRLGRREWQEPSS